MERRPSGFSYGVAGLAPIVVTAALVGLRGTVDRANLALILVLAVVVIAIIGGRGPAVLAAVVAAAAWDFFLTRPYLSLRIDDPDDVETAVILLVIGLVVGQVVAVARRSRAEASRGRAELALLRRFAERAAAGASVDELTRLVTDGLVTLLGLRACSFVSAPVDPDLPVLDRSGRVATKVRTLVDGEFALPGSGVRLPVVGGGHELGSLLLAPDPTVGVSLEQRLVAVALADQVGAARAQTFRGGGGA